MKLKPGYAWMESGSGVYCLDCGAQSHDKTIVHSSRCDLAPRKRFPLSDLIEAQEEKNATSAKPSIKKAAKEGNLRSSGYSDEEIVSAVRCGAISESDAMNQDD